MLFLGGSSLERPGAKEISSMAVGFEIFFDAFEA